MIRCPHCFVPLAAPDGPSSPASGPATSRPGSDRWWSRHEGHRDQPASAPSGGACPYCGLELPGDWTEQVSVCVTMAGARTTGKSIYIAVMIRQLEEYAATRGVDVAPASPAVAHQFEQYYVAPLYEERGVMPPTPPERVEDAHQRDSLVFVLTLPSGRQVRLVVRDVAGEDLERPHEVGPAGLDHVGRSDCVFFLFDPLKVPAIADKLADVIPRQALGGQAKAVLDTTLSLIRNGPTRLAVIMSKFDVMQALRTVEGAEEWARIMLNPGSTLLRDRGPNPHDAELLHEEVRSLLLLLEANTFVAAVERSMFHRPEGWRYFAVSALGESPNGDVLHSRGIVPFRCLDPLLWALAGSNIFF